MRGGPLRGKVMSGASLSFAFFALATCVILSRITDVRARMVLFFAVSLAFLRVFAPTLRSAVPLLAFVVMGYLATSLARRDGGRWQLPLVVVTLAAFFWLKRYAFVPAGVQLPLQYTTIGLSYMLFRQLHLLLDAGTDEGPRPTWLEHGAFMIGFTTLTAGPIARFEEFREGWRAGCVAPLTDARLGRAVERIIRGLFKAIVMASALASLRAHFLPGVVDGIPTLDRAVARLIVVGGYPLFLYCNFSGYIDVVLGASAAMGIDLIENFNAPFRSLNFIEFWGRWHISLSRWLRTYVYNPTLMNLCRWAPSRRLEPWWAVVSFFVTFFLVGVWHGQTKAFLFFGVLQGGGVALNKIYQLAMTAYLGRQRLRALSQSKFYRAACRGATYTWFAFSLIWFWADWPEAQTLAWRADATVQLATWSLLWLGAVVALEAVVRGGDMVEKAGASIRNDELALALRTVVSALLFTTTALFSLISTQQAPEIVYKNF